MQGVFDHRMKTWQKWQDSQLLLQKKREAEAKLQFTNKPDKLQQAKDEIKEVRQGGMNISDKVRNNKQNNKISTELIKDLILMFKIQVDFFLMKTE